MRASKALSFNLLVLLMGSTGAFAVDARNQSGFPNGTAQPSFLSEFRFGLSAQDPWGSEGRDDSANLTGEILLAKPFTASDLFTSYFIPRPHIGGSLNVDGNTSFAYTGLTWTFDLTPSVFVEGSLGGAVHNGKGHVNNPFSDRQSLGCSPLFRESGSVGVRLSANWSVMATVEHLSNAGTCSDNRGLTNIGARVGYSF
ncbi:acyloxyacyl hydrolase [Microvirga sp. 2YAF29]|uniref:acyloxyacyl hydrolase n=1 Tax=Microvirga sp. 2YAF29 TaxID=3233031 RepID=UPI003F9A6C99